MAFLAAELLREREREKKKNKSRSGEERSNDLLLSFNQNKEPTHANDSSRKLP